ncbi:MAG: AAA family ATPase, partial [Verrucomicrobiae bacterium]|nr:AAA family ATPase [Verrucomicrobiae bacterium]
ILFICGGAFVGLEDIISRRVGKRVLGFNQEHPTKKGESASLEPVTSKVPDVTPEDLLSFGLIPEFVGRLPVVSTLENLTREQLIRVLTEPKNAMVKQYSKLLAMDGVELELKEDGLEAMAEQALERGTGARALRSIFEKLMLDVMFESPSSSDSMMVTIDRPVVDGERPAAMERKEEKDAA